MTKKRDIIHEILAIQQRQRFGNAQAEVFVRLSDITSSFKKRNSSDQELLRYYPVALVACIESAIRLLIKELIDFGPPFTERAAKLAATIKFDYDVVNAFQGKTISIGDFLSHALRINNLSDIQTHMSDLFQSDYLDKLRDVRDRWAAEIHEQPNEPIIRNTSKTFAKVSRTFELRHIFSHELATSYKVDTQEIGECIESCDTFVKAIVELQNHTLYPDAPLTQTDMNIQAGKDMNKAKEELKELNTNIESLIGSERAGEYRLVHQAWEHFRDLAAEFQANEYKGGTIWPTIFGIAGREETILRIDQVKKYIDLIKNEGDI